VRRSVALISAAATVAALVPAAFAATGHGNKPAIYLVGGAAREINPTDEMLDLDGDHAFFLGGYGFGSGRVANTVEVPVASDAIGNRYATGILGDGAHTRAFLVSDGRHTVVLAQIETQGYFSAYKQGPFGLNEIRKDAADRIAKLAAPAAAAATTKAKPAKQPLTAPAPTPSEIVVDSDHSHGGADTAGVWGGVPTSYLKKVHDQTVDAIVDAWQHARPSTLSYGVALAGVNGETQYPPQECVDAGHPDCQGVANADWLLNNQFAYDPANQTMDNEVRVLQARDPETGDVLDTYVNFSAHPTVLGDQKKVTGDYVGRLNLQIEQAFGGFAMDQVATLGRTQPTDRGCSTATDAMSEDDKNLCALDQYAARVLVKVKAAAAKAKPFTGAPVVAMNSYFLSDTTTSAVLAGIVYAGQAIGAPAARAANAPWYTGSQLGTSYYVGRIGSVLVSGGPGEMYPQISQKLRKTVEDSAESGKDPDAAGITGFMNIGTAGDFLGYIIAPLESYQEPAKRSFLDGDNMPSPVDNDNYFFNISHTFGERLTCDFLRGAGDVLTGDAQTYWSTYQRCAAFVTDLVLPAGTDTQFPQQPDLSAALTHL
jgi:hypothetical protein